MPRRAYQQLTQPAVHRGGVATAVLVVLLLAGCGRTATGITLSTPAPEAPGPVSAAPVATEPPVTSSPSVSPSAAPGPAGTRTPVAPQTEEQQIIAAYTAYYNLVVPLSAMPASSRPAALARVATDPLYSAVLKETAERDADGKVPYGVVVLHPRVAALQGNSAAIADCLDTSRSGLMSKATGEKLTVGVKQFKRLSGMKRGGDGLWRVSTVEGTVQGRC